MEEELEDRIRKGIFPSVIYKFRSWDDEPNDHILRKRVIRLASPKELMADYPEAYLPIDESQITEENMQKHALYMAKSLYPGEHLHFQRMKAEELRREMKIEDPEHRRRAEAYDLQRTDETLGIFCATTKYHDLYLWVNFGNLGTGFAVGLDTKKIVLHPSIYGSADLVKYYPVGDPPKLSPFSFSALERINKGLKRIFNIPDKYKPESEFRIARTTRNKDASGSITKYSEDERMVQLDSDCYVEILLGYDIPKDDKSEIIKIRDQYLKGIPIYTTEIEDNKVIKKDRI